MNTIDLGPITTREALRRAIPGAIAFACWGMLALMQALGY